jgi:hypothetical protein
VQLIDYLSMMTISDMKLVDLDGDGHLDIVAVGKSYGEYTGPDVVRWVFGRGDGTFGDCFSFYIGTPDTELRSFDCADLDGDGDLDLVCATRGVPDKLLYFDHGGNTFIPSGNPFGPLHGDVNPVQLMKLDGDNLWDAVLMRQRAPGSGTTYYSVVYQGLGGGLFEYRQALPEATYCEMGFNPGFPGPGLISVGQNDDEYPVSFWPNLLWGPSAVAQDEVQSGDARSLHVSPSVASRSVRIDQRSPRGRAQSVNVVDATGRLVHVLHMPATGMSWDLRDAQGTPLRSGVYWLRPVSQPGGNISTRFTVVR